jgi:hypothetical protein
MGEQLRVERDGAVAWLTFDNVRRRNALSIAMCRSVMAELARIEEDADVHVVVLSGAGDEAFMSGADISEQDDPAAPEAITAYYAALAAARKPVPTPAIFPLRMSTSAFSSRPFVTVRTVAPLMSVSPPCAAVAAGAAGAAALPPP